MTNPLEEACIILDEFEKEIAALKDFQQQMAIDDWTQNYHRMWLHGTADHWERWELERWLMDYPPSTATANSYAASVFGDWREWLAVAGPIKKERVVDYDKKKKVLVEIEKEIQSEAFYADHDKFEIPEPEQEETLYDFIVRLATWIEEEYDHDKKRVRKEKKIGAWLKERALKSFLHFIRANYPSEEVAFIEHIFPLKMDLHYGRIIRLIPLEAYPIPEKTAAEILIELSRKCQKGNLTARYTALESLVLCWLCIASSRVRLPKNLEKIRAITPQTILSGAEFGLLKHPTFGSKIIPPHLTEDSFSVLRVPTWFGEQPLKISNRIATLLKIVASIPSKKPRTAILQRSRQKLDKMLSSALESVSPNPEYGNITYSSLLINQPHIHGDHRPQPKY